MIGIILSIVYILGILCHIWIEKKFFPFEEGDYELDWDGPHEETEEMWKAKVCTRALLWPIVLAFVVVMLPIVIVDIIIDKI